jgi:uncharacterized Rossmann fold enzyme
LALLVQIDAIAMQTFHARQQAGQFGIIIIIAHADNRGKTANLVNNIRKFSQTCMQII